MVMKMFRCLSLLAVCAAVSCWIGALAATPRTGAAGAVKAGQPPEAWSDWAKWAEKQLAVTDAEGHGPDIGGDEWAMALGRKLNVTDPELKPKSKEWRAAIEQKLADKAAPAEQRELLAAHETVAKFDGIADHVCMGRTSMCPDRCGHSGQMATFTIVKYLRYEKPGQYGDPKQDRFMVLVEDNQKNPKVPAAIRDAIMALKPGETVKLAWNHDYVTRGGSKSPERPIRQLSPLSAAEAKKLLEKE